MNATALVTLILILTVVWGGFIVCLLWAIRSEHSKK